MSTPTPAYYPDGWDRERMLNSAANGELDNLSEDQLTIFRDGLRADVGEEGFERFFDEMVRRELNASGMRGKLQEAQILHPLETSSQLLVPILIEME
jgi:hypothetical protein